MLLEGIDIEVAQTLERVVCVCTTGAFGEVVVLELAFGDGQLRSKGLGFDCRRMEEVVQLAASIVRG